MTTTKDLTEAQATALMRVLAMSLGTEDGWVSEYQARFGGANLQKLRVLVRRGHLVAERRPFILPTGPYAGQTVTETFYSIPE